MRRRSMRWPRVLMSFVVLALIIFGCDVLLTGSDKKNDENAEAGTYASRTIGPEGGVIETKNGAKIDIPTGALTDEVSITLSSFTNNSMLPSAWCPMPGMGGAVRLEPEGLVFDKPVTITVPMDAQWNPG